jgi:hypothetical protein
METKTFKDLMIGYNNYNLTYARKGGSSNNVKFYTPEEVIRFLNENIYKIDILSINDTNIDVDKIIEKYKV